VSDVDSYGYVVLDNLGPTGWNLRIRAGQTVHHVQFANAHLREDQSPLDYAVAELAALGWRVHGDWYVQAWTGPAADTTWAAIEPLNPTPETRS
jgi:hypothetical protein